MMKRRLEIVLICAVIGVGWIFTLYWLFGIGEDGQILCGRVWASIVVGFIFAFLGWRYRREYTDLNIPSIRSFLSSFSYYGRLSSGGSLHIVAGGFIFLVSGVSGYTWLFEIETDYQSYGQPFCNGFNMLMALTGMFWGLYLGGVGSWFDYALLRSDLLGYFLMTVSALLWVGMAAAISVLFFNGSIFFPVMVIGRMVGRGIIYRFSENNIRPAVMTMFVLVVVTLLFWYVLQL